MRWSFSIVIAALAALAWVTIHDSFDANSVSGQRVLVCGASTGIGEQLVYQYARAGADMVIVSRSRARLDAVAAEALKLARVPIAVHVVTADLMQEESAVAVVEQAVGKLGGLDVVVLNHIYTANHSTWGTWSGPRGRGKAGPELLRNIFALNVFSYVNIATAALPHLERAAGSVVVVSSQAGKVGLPKMAPYSASKHALHGFFDSLRHELVLRGSNASVTLCVIGSIDTDTNIDHTQGELNPNLKYYPADEAAFAIMRAGATRAREAFYPAAEILPLVLLRPFIPDTLDAVIRHVMLSANATV